MIPVKSTEKGWDGEMGGWKNEHRTSNIEWKKMKKQRNG